MIRLYGQGVSNGRVVFHSPVLRVRQNVSRNAWKDMLAEIRDFDGTKRTVAILRREFLEHLRRLEDIGEIYLPPSLAFFPADSGGARPSSEGTFWEEFSARREEQRKSTALEIDPWTKDVLDKVNAATLERPKNEGWV